MKTLGIIGCGNMGGAMLRRICSSGLVAADEIVIADKNAALRSRLAAELGVQAAAGNEEAARCETLLLAVKPQFLPDVCVDIAPVIEKDTLLLSIVAGCSMDQLRAHLSLPDDAHLIRIMPNTPALVGEGMLAVCRSGAVTEDEWAFAGKLLSSMGLVLEVPEKMMDAVTGLSGSSPAFAFMFMEALADAGVRGGLPRDAAQKMAAQVLLGCGKMALETGRHPGELKDMVTSPAGTTIEGVAALEKRGFRGAVMEAVEAAIEKARSLRS